MSSTGYVFDDLYLTHDLGQGHPESAGRLRAIQRLMAERGLDRRVSQIDPVAGESKIERAIFLIHSPAHLASISECPASARAARRAVGGALAAVDAVMAGQVRMAFCAVRPPGHHAHNNGAHYDGRCTGEGFCFFNNAAIAARYAQREHGIGKVLILDWDYHHGNGTEWAFYEDPSVFFFSTHTLRGYPGTGDPARQGSGAGYGYSLNVPLDRGATDEDIINAWQQQLLPALQRQHFEPDFVIISAGFDSRENDTLGDFSITDQGYVRLTEMAIELARTHARGKLVSILEGGYNPSGLASAVTAHIGAMLAAQLPMPA
jgi:acetoin utilization deacetylase AcuC-like enzyme